MRITICCLLLSLGIIGAHAQTQAGQLDISVCEGLYPGRILANFSASSENEGPKDKVPVPSYSANCRYFILDRLAVGISVSKTGFDGYWNDDNYPGGPSGAYHIDLTTAAVEINFMYWNIRRVQFYCLGGIAATFVKGTWANIVATTNADFNKDTYPAIQIDPIGIRFGGRFSGFVELGIGYKGIVNGGIALRLFGESEREKKWYQQ